MRPCAVALALLAILALPACATYSREYVESVPAYSTTKGRIERVENLSSQSHEDLGDGVAIKVDRAGGRVVLLIDGASREIDLAVNSIVVYADDGDYVMVPLSDAAARRAAPEPWSAVEEASEDIEP